MCYVNLLMDDGYQTPHESTRACEFDGPASENYVKHFSKKQLLQNIVLCSLNPSLTFFSSETGGIYIKSA